MRAKILFIAVMSLFSVSYAAENFALPKISHSQYVGGGVASIFLPWGIGQAIQGRYGETGWIFTVSELAATGLLMVGSVWFVVGASLNSEPAGGFMLAMLGGSAFFGLRIWEIVDAWATPKSQNRVADVLQQSNQKIAFMPIVAPNFLGLSLQF